MSFSHSPVISLMERGGMQILVGLKNYLMMMDLSKERKKKI